MKIYNLIWLTLLTLCLWTIPATAADRPPGTILGELDAVSVPRFEPSRKGDRDYTREFLAVLERSTRSRNDLILELFRAAPDHARIPDLMAERWAIRPFSLPADVLAKEVDETLNRTTNPRLKVEAAFARANAAINDEAPGTDFDPKVVDRFLELAPKDERGANLLRFAAAHTREERQRTAFEDRILAEFPETAVARKIAGVRNRSKLLGKPLTLEFKDAITGAAVSTQRLRGKIVVLDFWATWCVPCVNDLPRTKAICAKYRERGVEFVGISLDLPDGPAGLDRFRTFVKDRGIAWPQYYQGEGWESGFSVSCGIQAIPTAFVLDGEGIVRSIDAGDGLERIIGELLDARDRARP